MKAILFVGPGKTGTSFVYKYLQGHSDLTPSNVKETGYFFEPKGDFSQYFEMKTGSKYVYEVSNTYFKSESAMANIVAASFDEVHIVIIRRESVARALSHVKFIVRNGNADNNPKELLERFPEVIESSRYKHYSTLWEKSFGASVHYIDYESDPQKFADNVNGFIMSLGLEEIKSAPEVVNKSMSPRSRMVARSAKTIATIMRSAGLLGTLQSIKDSSLVNRIIFSDKKEVSVDVDAYSAEIARQLEKMGEL